MGFGVPIPSLFPFLVAAAGKPRQYRHCKPILVLGAGRGLVEMPASH
jgi:hypothetical protein